MTFLTEVEVEREDKIVYRSNICTAEDAALWLKNYQIESKTHWIVRDCTANPKRVTFTKLFKCQLSSFNKSTQKSSKRNWDCKANLRIVIKHLNVNTIKNDRKYLKREIPLRGVITISKVHSHPTGSSDALRFLRPDKEICDVFNSYFESGMPAAVAKRFHEALLDVESDLDPSKPPAIEQSGQINPNDRTIRHWFSVWKGEHGKVKKPAPERIKEKIEQYCGKGTELKLCEKQNAKGTTVWSLIVVTPIMKRLQQECFSREIISVATVKVCDVTSSNLTMLLAATQAGSFPICILLHTREEGYELAFQNLKENFACFGGQQAPQMFITDDCPAQKKALRAVWPDSSQLLCHYRLQQEEWRWLTRECSSKDERRFLMTNFRKLVYANNEEILRLEIDQFHYCTSPTSPKFLERINQLVSRKEEWVLCYRQGFLPHSLHTSQFIEASVRILKDVLLSRTKSFTVATLVDFIIEVMEKFFKARLLRYARNRHFNLGINHENLCVKLPRDVAKGIQIVEDSIFLVPASSPGEQEAAWNEINTSLGSCDCSVGSAGGLCKHEALIIQEYGLSPQCPAITNEDCLSLTKLALGDECTLSIADCELQNQIKSELLRIVNLITRPASLSSQDSELLPILTSVKTEKKAEQFFLNMASKYQLKSDAEVQTDSAALRFREFQYKRVHIVDEEDNNDPLVKKLRSEIIFCVPKNETQVT